MIRLLHIPFLMGLLALIAFDAPEKVVVLVGAFTLGLSFGIEAVLTLTGDPQAHTAATDAHLHKWKKEYRYGAYICWRCEDCRATCDTHKWVTPTPGSCDNETL